MSFHPVVCLVWVFLTAPVWGQALQTGPASSPQGSPIRVDQLPEAPVPADPLELVTGDAQLVATPEDRAQIIQLLQHARYLSNVRATAYDLKTTFTSYGQSASEGTWQLEDASPDSKIYRWTAQSASYSVANLFRDEVLYSNQPAGTIPLRLAQVRGSIFFAYLAPLYLHASHIRTAPAILDGRQLTCALFTDHSYAPNSAGGRRWDESEYCIDRTSGLLMSYSAAPGVYVAYDYKNSLRIEDRIVPRKITITEAGATIIEASLQSLTSGVDADSAIFSPTASMTAIGSGSLMSLPWHLNRVIFQGAAGSASNIQPVVIHGIITPQGVMSEAEIVQTSNSNLNQAALDAAKKWQFPDRTAPGATPQEHEVFLTVKFVSAGS